MERKKALIVGPSFQALIFNKLILTQRKLPNLDIKIIPRGNYISNIFKYLYYRALNESFDIIHIIYPAHRIAVKMLQHAVKNKNKKIILHWVGTDILLAKQRKELQFLSSLGEKIINLVVAPWLKSELEDGGVPVEDVVPIVPPEIDENKPLPYPKEPAILYYLPKGREQFYGFDILKLIATSFPDVKILVVGGGKTPSNPNIVNLGKIPRSSMRKVYEETTVLARYTKHDGLPLMALEALSFGRRVVFNKPMPGAIYVTSPGELTTKIHEALFSKNVTDSTKKGLPECFKPSKVIRKLAKIWNID